MEQIVTNLINIVFAVVAILIVCGIVVAIILAIKSYKKTKQVKESVKRTIKKATDIIAEKAEEPTKIANRKEFCEYCRSRLNSKGVCPNCGAKAEWSESEK